jgi:hypothetical protein
MSDSIRSGGVDADGEVTVGEDIVGRDKIVSTTNVYAGLTIGDMFRLRLVQTYERLWGLLEPLARYGRTAPFTAESAGALSERLRRWYFEEAGGLYLFFSPDHAARDKYMQLQDTLGQVIDQTGPDLAKSVLPQSTFELARQRGSDLRHAMAEEVRSYMQPTAADRLSLAPIAKP